VEAEGKLPVRAVNAACGFPPRQFAVAHGVLYRAMPQPILNPPRIMSCIGQGVAARVEEHVTMDLEGQAGALTDALLSALTASGVNGPPRSVANAKALSGNCLCSSLQSAQFISSERMNGGLTILCPPHVQRSSPTKFNLRPFEVANLDCPESMSVGDQN
jgi:hypothetical protein